MKALGLILFTGIIISLIILTPFAIIWALNTLFALNIAYTFWSWLAVIVLNLTWLHKPQLKKGG